jgi:cellulose synthase/poly-beta-1,6-N-acetylglucosamine synthase-like glycosyltransferase
MIGLTYIYVGYPLLIWLLAQGSRRSIRKNSGLSGSCSVVIASFREGPVLLKKVESLFDSSALGLVREIIIGLDGPLQGDDSTPAQIEALRDGCRDPGPTIRVIPFPERRGKAAVLNDLVPMTNGDILIMMDARQPIHPEAIGALLANFSDEGVGVVSGELVFRDGDAAHESGAAQEGVGFYWRYEKFIRRCEARFRSVPGATGALYAIRRRLFKPIPAGTLLDDVAIPMQAVVQGARCIFEPAAVVYDMPSSSTEQESVRKRRTIAGVAQLMCFYPEWLLPWRNPIWFEYVSHKVLRLSSPILLVGLFACNLRLLENPVFRVFFALQVAFYLLALGGMVAQRLGKRAGCLGIPMMFVALNVTTALALWDALCGRYNAAWKK